MSDPIRAALERLVTAYDTNEGLPIEEWLQMARTALAAAPPAPAPTINDLLELCEDHEFHLGIDGANEEESAEGLLQIIRVALSRWGNQPPAPDHLRTATEMVADGEREELAQWLDRFHEYAYELGRPDWGHMTTRAAALLRQPAPAPVSVSVPVPVPVSWALGPWERPGWCDAEGRCWFAAPVAGVNEARWTLTEPLARLKRETFFLPHWAIPIPIPQPPHANTPTPTPEPQND